MKKNIANRGVVKSMGGGIQGPRHPSKFQIIVLIMDKILVTPFIFEVSLVLFFSISTAHSYYFSISDN